MVALSYLRLLVLTGSDDNAETDAEVTLTVTHPSGEDTWTVNLDDPNRDDREAAQLDDYRLLLSAKSDREHREWVAAGRPIEVGSSTSLDPVEVQRGPSFASGDLTRLGLALTTKGNDAWQLTGYWLTGRFNWVETPPGSIDGVLKSAMVGLSFKNSIDIWLSTDDEEGRSTISLPIDRAAPEILGAAVRASNGR